MRRFYFKPGSRWPTGRLPAVAIRECSAPGPCDDAVAYWTAALRFTADPDLVRDYLRGFGAWDADDLADDAQNLQRTFWLLCSNRRYDPTYPLYLGE